MAGGFRKATQPRNNFSYVIFHSLYIRFPKPLRNIYFYKL
jgi:hypothetical protein